MIKAHPTAVVLVSALGIVSAMVAIAVSGTEGSRVAYPEDYRDWTHVKSMVIQEGHPLYESFGGIHHIYANAKALDAMRQGNAYPDGSLLIFDLLEAEQGENAIQEGERKVLGVMEKDGEEFARTGGWGFQAFKGNTRQRVVDNPAKACFECHTSQKNNDYVFSKYRE